MQLDDVGRHTSSFPFHPCQLFPVPSLTVGPRVGEAMQRSVRWLDRCIQQHEQSGKKDIQNLFAIVQGGLDPELRDLCLDEMIQRKDRVAGYAIGGLSGGEAKGKVPSGVTKHAHTQLTNIHGFRYLLENVRVVHLLVNP